MPNWVVSLIQLMFIYSLLPIAHHFHSMCADTGDLSSGDYNTRCMPTLKRLANPPLSMDNPEYHIMNQDGNTSFNPSSPSYLSQTCSLSGLPVGNGATLGIPVNSMGIGTIGAAGQPVQFPVGNFGPRNQYLTQRSSEEEGSDHDYYNDLQRELQPLQPLKRNETTV